MARKLAPNTIKKFEKRLLAEREQLLTMLEQHQKERENIRISEASAERSPDPTSADGGSMAFELEKELTLELHRNVWKSCKKICRLHKKLKNKALLCRKQKEMKMYKKNMKNF